MPNPSALKTRPSWARKNTTAKASSDPDGCAKTLTCAAMSPASYLLHKQQMEAAAYEKPRSEEAIEDITQHVKLSMLPSFNEIKENKQTKKYSSVTLTRISW